MKNWFGGSWLNSDWLKMSFWREMVALMPPMISLRLAMVVTMLIILLIAGFLKVTGYFADVYHAANTSPASLSVNGSESTQLSLEDYLSPEQLAVMRPLLRFSSQRGGVRPRFVSQNGEKLRISGVADNRSQVSIYVGELEKMGLRNYVIDINESNLRKNSEVSFVVSGKVTNRE